MNNRERSVNQALQKLGDAYRFGRLSLDDYRLKRRELLGALRPGDTETERNPLLPDELDAAPGSALASHLPKASRVAGHAASTSSRRLWWLGGAVFALGVLALAALIVTEPSSQAVPAANGDTAPPAGTAGHAEVPLDAATAAAERAAQALVDANDWQALAIAQWLAQWQALSADGQRQLRARPALQGLRDQARYRLSVDRALAIGDLGTSDAASDSASDSGSDGAAARTRSLQALLDAIDAGP